jgi:hypothetical protein
MHRECIRREIEHVGAGHVSRHQIRRALNSLESEATDASQRLDGEGLRQTWNAFDHGVAAADQNENELLDNVTLPDDYFRDLTLNMG